MSLQKSWYIATCYEKAVQLTLLAYPHGCMFDLDEDGVVDFTCAVEPCISSRNLVHRHWRQWQAMSRQKDSALQSSKVSFEYRFEPLPEAGISISSDLCCSSSRSCNAKPGHLVNYRGGTRSSSGTTQTPDTRHTPPTCLSRYPTPRMPGCSSRATKSENLKISLSIFARC